MKQGRFKTIREAVSVGGKNPKYGKAVLTRPGESPGTFNGEDLRKVRDNHGRVGNVKCKFYTGGDPNSEYIMTDAGSVRRIKGDQGRGDDGLHGWCDMALFHEEVTDGKLNSMVKFFLRFNRKRGESERLHFSIDLKGGSAYLWVQDNANGGRWTCVPEKMFEKQGVLMKCLLARDPLPDMGVAPIQSGFVTEPKVGLEILEISFDFSEDHGHRPLTAFHNGHAVCHIEKQKPVRESDRQIEYWAHMLDEAFGADLGDRSYWAVWLEEYPRYRPNSPEIKRYLAQLFDRRMQAIGGLEGKLRKYAKAFGSASGLIPYERMKSALLAAFGPEITDREFFWEPIPAQTYRALVSRSRARSQGQTSRDVSPRVIKGCLDSICRAAAIITTHSSLGGGGGGGVIDVSGTRTAKMLREAGGSADKWCLGGLYVAVSSFCTFENGQALAAVYDRFQKKYGKKYAGNDWMDDYFDEYAEACQAATKKKGAGDWLTNSSDGEIGKDIEYDLKKEPYDVYERPERAVPLISILVDKAHIRGDVAGAFVEGGAPTCQAVSDMAPDELYEGRS